MIEYYKDVMHTIEDSLESIDENLYEQIIEECVDTLKNGGKIIASGLGKNVPICEKFVGTERTDRTGVNREERSQMNYVPMEMDGNIQAIINISYKRLCTCADPTTRQY